MLSEIVQSRCRVTGKMTGRSIRFSANDSNIGRFTTIRNDLQPGPHDVTCELLQETADPEGGHEFRIISIMRWAYPWVRLTLVYELFL